MPCAPITRLEVVADPSAFGALRSAFGDTAEFSVFRDDGSTDDALDTIATALRLVAVIAAIAGAATVVLAIARSTRATVRDRQALIALGTTRVQLVGAALLVVIPAVAVGALLGGLLGAVVTPDVMVGLAARIEPSSTRTALDWPTVIGAIGGAIALVGCCASPSSRRAACGRRVPRARPPVAIVPLDRPLPVVLGLRHAVTGESERGGRTSRAAIVVGVLGVIGVVAALTVSSSILNLRVRPLPVRQRRDGPCRSTAASRARCSTR